MVHASLVIAKNEHVVLVKNFLSSISHDERKNFVGDIQAFSASCIESGLLFVVIVGNKVVAVSSIAPLSATLVETRTCFVSPEYRGFGLQRLMHEARAVEVRRRWGGNCRAVSAVKRTTQAAVPNLLKLGFEPWHQPDDVVFGPCKECAKRNLASLDNCCCDFFLCDRNDLTELSERLLKSPVKELVASDSRRLVVDCSSIVLASGNPRFQKRDTTIAGPPPVVFWLTGISGAGKTTVARSMDSLFRSQGWQVATLDGDDLRGRLNADLGFSDKDRAENVRRIAEVASLMADVGVITIVSCISRLASLRENAKNIVGRHRFFEVFIDTPMYIAEQRDPKGLYKMARAGEIKAFTGVHTSYEEPLAPDVRIDTTVTESNMAAAVIYRYYEETSILPASAGSDAFTASQAIQTGCQQPNDAAQGETQ